MRGDPRALSLVENLFDLFSDEAINWDAASAIGKIAAPADVLTKTNHAVTKVRTGSFYRAYETGLIGVDCVVPCRSEIYEPTVTTVDEECARVIK